MDKLYALIQKTPMVQKLALVGIILALMGAGFYFLIYQEQQEQIKGLVTQLNKLEDERQEKQEIASNLSKHKKRLEYLAQKLEDKKKNLPDEAKIDALLKTLTIRSEESDIRILNFAPQSEVHRNFYAEVPVKMELEGNYHEILTFFDKVAKEDRIINISDINLGDPKVKNGKVMLKASCIAKTFRALLPGEPTQEQGKGKGGKAKGKPKPAAK